MDRQPASYVIAHYSNFMTQSERRAYSHLTGTMKMTGGRSDVAAQEEVKREKPQHRLLSDDPEVLRLANEGMQTFVERIAARILADRRDDIFLNHSHVAANWRERLRRGSAVSADMTGTIR
jgi:hypothetical protein